MNRPATIAAALVTLGFAVGAEAGPPTFSTLNPGGLTVLAKEVPVNIVFVGYEEGAGASGIDVARFLDGLPQSYRTVNRYPAFYGLAAGAGIEFTYAYTVTFASSPFEDAFFGHLTSIAQTKDRTLFQDLYNAEGAGAQVVGQNHWIDGPSVEAWLAANPPPGVDTTRPTVFFVNWYGRPDFRFHVYTKTDEPDADTGYNFGEVRASRKLIAWGGSPNAGNHRIWFHDLSAGPESWTTNYSITAADVDGDGRADYRMPPVWDYGNPNGYRPFDDLSGDLSKLTRYVAVNLLFTSSPLYKPAISAPRLPSTINVDVNVYQGLPGVADGDLHKPALISESLQGLQPLNAFTTTLTPVAFDNRAYQVYTCFLVGVSCFGNSLFGISFGDLYLQHDKQLLQFLEGDADYEVPVFNYKMPESLGTGGLLGFADDNWRDGTQSYVFTFWDPFFASLGYGMTGTTIHEVGHHLGMSHPHDGYDAESNVDYGPSGVFYFAWAGDESHTVMAYTDLTREFGQFDRDNMNRYLTSSYLNQANQIIANVLASARASKGYAALGAAETLATQSVSAFAAFDYGLAAAKARAAYSQVLAAAVAANVRVEPQAYQADYKAKGLSPKFIDTVPYQRMQP